MNSDIEPIHTPENTRHDRSIRSYVLRQGRLSNAQERYLNTMMGKIGIVFTPQKVDFAQIFARQAPCILEIGFGMGETLAQVAIAHPERNYVGIEVHSPGVGNLCKLIAEQNIPNLRLIQHDAVEVLNDMIAPNSLAGVQIFFPDPWPKKRHHKRRLIQAPLVHLLATRLIPGGFIHCATDWQEYAEQMLTVLSAAPLLHNSVADFAPRPASRPRTKFEQRGLGLGHGVWDLFFLRNE